MTYPVIKTARALVFEGVLPCSEELVRTLAKRHGIGRLLGRTLIFTPADIERLLESLPLPSNYPDASSRPVTSSGGLSAAAACAKALALASAKRPKKPRRAARPR